MEERKSIVTAALISGGDDPPSRLLHWRTGTAHCVAELYKSFLLFDQGRHLPKPGMLSGLQPLKEDHLGRHDVGPMSLQSFERRLLAFGAPRSDGVTDDENLAAGFDQPEGGLKDADMRLPAGHDNGMSFGEARKDVRRRVERHLVDDKGGVRGEVAERRSQALRVLLREKSGDAKDCSRVNQTPRVGDGGRGVFYRWHQFGLEVDHQQRRCRNINGQHRLSLPILCFSASPNISPGWPCAAPKSAVYFEMKTGLARLFD